MKDDKNIEEQKNMPQEDDNNEFKASTTNSSKDIGIGGDTHNLDQEYIEDKKADISSLRSLVSADPKQNMMIIGVALLLIIFAGYYFFFGGGSHTTQTLIGNDIPLDHGRQKIKGQVGTPILSSSANTSPSYEVAVNPDLIPQSSPVPATPSPFAVPTPASPQPTSNPPAPKILTQPPLAPQSHSLSQHGTGKDVEITANSAQQVQAKIKSSIMLTNGQSGSNPAGKSGSTITRDLTNSFTPTATTAPASQLTAVGDMSGIVAQGKIIETVLETPINTNYPGPIRAMISRDVYSEMGSNVLIPKGSRVLGTMAGGYTAGQTRVIITWNRIIMPNGYDMQVQGSPGVDKLGMIGVEGIVDRQLWNTLGNALLISAINIGLADLVQNGFNVGAQTSTVSTGTDGVQTSTNTLTPVQQSAQTSLANLSTTFQQWLSSNFTVKPFIDLDQGTIVKIFVNADLQFPSYISSGVNVIK
jgi:type IV secretion system protein VirB10